MIELAIVIASIKGTVVRVTVVPAGKDDSETRVVALVRGELKIKDQAPLEPEDLELTIWLLNLGIRLAHL